MAVLAVDMGGTVVKAAVVDADRRVVGEVNGPSAEGLGPEAWLVTALELACESRAAAAAEGVEPVALGLSVPGAVDPDRCVLVDLVDRLPTGEGLSLADGFAPLGLPVFADNDARAALAAEQRWGVARDMDNVVMLTLGTGLGGAALVQGRPAGGERVLAGNQVGHLTIELDGPRCVCGNRGCAELYASATGLMRMAAEAGSAADDSASVFLLAEDGDPAAAAAVGRFSLALAIAIVNAIHAYQPDMIVLAGGLMGSADAFLPAVRALVAERAWTIPRGRVCVEPSALGSRIGVLGAAAIAERRAS